MTDPVRCYIEFILLDACDIWLIMVLFTCVGLTRGCEAQVTATLGDWGFNCIYTVPFLPTPFYDDVIL